MVREEMREELYSILKSVKLLLDDPNVRVEGLVVTASTVDAEGNDAGRLQLMKGWNAVTEAELANLSSRHSPAELSIEHELPADKIDRPTQEQLKRIFRE